MPTTQEDVQVAMDRMAQAKRTLIAKRMRADAAAVHLFEAADRMRQEAVTVHQAAVKAEGVEEAAADLKRAEGEAERLLKEWGMGIWADVRCAVPTRPDATPADAPTPEGSLKRVGVP